MTTPENEQTFSTIFPIIVHTRPAGSPHKADWQEFDHGEGLYHLPGGVDVSVRVHNIGDAELAQLARELSGVASLRLLNLSENRKITSDGLKALRLFPGLTMLNLSSCSLTNDGLENMLALTRLEWLDLTFCNRLTDPALKTIAKLPRLEFLDLQGCVKITQGGIARLRRRNLEIHR